MAQNLPESAGIGASGEQTEDETLQQIVAELEHVRDEGGTGMIGMQDLQETGLSPVPTRLRHVF